MQFLLAAVLAIHIDAAADRHPIDPRIYGVNFATTAQLRELGAPLNRSGGNATTRYNWQQRASNHAFDWYFESLEEEPIDTFIDATRSAGAEPMITIPMMGWVAKLGPQRQRLASYSIAKYGAQQGSDWQWFPDAGNGVRTNGTEITGNDPHDANLPADANFQRPWVHSMSSSVRYFVLDNEHSLWHSTHRDVQPAGATMEDVRARMIAHAQMIREEAPDAIILGPEEWGWSGYLLSGYDQQWAAKHQNWSSTPDRMAHGGADYVPWLLAETHAFLDVFTLHFYPQGGEFSNDVSTAMQLRRNRSTRALWDPLYRDETWIDDEVRLIPRMKAWAAPYNLAIGITEYSWGADTHINGGTAQADILGILGREGVDLATRWVTPPTGSPAYNAFVLYRTFGQTSVRAIAPNPDEVAAFAAHRSDGILTVMLINKTFAAKDVALDVSHFTPRGVIRRTQMTASGIARVADLDAPTLALPAQSVTLLELPGAKKRRAVR